MAGETRSKLDDEVDAAFCGTLLPVAVLCWLWCYSAAGYCTVLCFNLLDFNVLHAVVLRSK